MMTKEEKLEAIIVKALEIIVKYGGTDGSHHKDWVMDQVVRILTGNNYESFVNEACKGPNGEPNLYSWDCGIAPQKRNLRPKCAHLSLTIILSK